MKPQNQNLAVYIGNQCYSIKQKGGEMYTLFGIRISLNYIIEEGILKGTIIEPIMAFIGIKYPHRKTKDLYIPPMKGKNKTVKTWHCCQQGCSKPDFETKDFLSHLEKHAGRLIKQPKKCPS